MVLCGIVISVFSLVSSHNSRIILVKSYDFEVLASVTPSKYYIKN